MSPIVGQETFATDVGLGYLAFVDVADVADPFTGVAPAGDPEWRELPNQQALSVDLEAELVDSRSKAQAGWKASKGTGRGMSIQASGQLDESSEAAAFLNGVWHGASSDRNVNLLVQYANGDCLILRARLASYSVSMGHDEITNWSATFESDGEPKRYASGALPVGVTGSDRWVAP